MIEYDSFIYGLAIACPLHNCDQSCPIDKIREMPIRKRLDYLEVLSKEEKSKLLTKHKTCIEQFEEKYFHNTTE